MNKNIRMFYYKILNPFYNLKLRLSSNPKFIVIGNPKTGTSVISSLIAEQGNLTKTIDIPEMWYKQMELYKGDIDLEKFISKNAHRFTKSLVKEPDLTFLYNKITNVFSESKIILIVRHPVDNIRSVLDRVNIDPDDLPIDIKKIDKMDIIDPWKWFVNGDVLRSNPTNKIPYTMAYNWVYTVNLYLNNQESIYLIRYEDFVKNKIKSISDYCEDLNIKKINDISDLVDKQYQPKGENKNKNVKKLFSTEVIEKIENICSAEMKELDYEFYSKK
ncbi:sulfotransferase domain-containing protein [Halanaerobium congolense]|uniref:Sulfotransferase domain-containing protein n=1 Tax=Halanaerobium congolense TaxID=54121 RepID=A0A1G6SSN9_9FIRM|nr:sulfotransferase domain-containing protein [Halanaerobium congolense]SDD19145.1 Sulfotransferase domain-containing protein [Halanaerobium congolense]